MKRSRSFSCAVLIVFATVLLTLSGCSSSKAPVSASALVNEGYARALNMFNKKDYQGASLALESLLFTSRATALEDDVLYLLGQSYFRSGDYLLAADMFIRLQQLSASPFARTSQFMVAKSFEELSPHFELDQQYTRKAIEHYTLYQELYPVADSSKIVRDAEKLKELVKANPSNAFYKESYSEALARFSRIDSLR